MVLDCSKGSSSSPSQGTFLLQLEKELELEVWDSLEADSWAFRLL